MKGYVKIFENGVLIRERHNLILNEGRRLQAHRFTNVRDVSKDYTNYFLSHFCVGTNGADAFNLLIPIEPNPEDTIENMLPLYFKDPSIFYNDYALQNKLKKISNIEIVSYYQVNLTMQLNTDDITYDELNDAPKYYNELGLFATLNGDGTDPILVARFTTSLTPKTKFHSQTIYWSLFF